VQNGIKGNKNEEYAKIGRLKGLKLEHFIYYLIVMFQDVINLYLLKNGKPVPVHVNMQ